MADTKETITEGVEALTLNGKPESEQVETGTDAQAQEGAPEAPAEDVVDPWNVASSNDAGVDYDKLISKHVDSSWQISQNNLWKPLILTRCRTFRVKQNRCRSYRSVRENYWQTSAPLDQAWNVLFA